MIESITFPEDLRAKLADALPEMDIRHHVDNGDVDTARPYTVLTVTAEQELVRGNHTWEMSIVLELHAHAYDTPGDKQQQAFRQLCAVLRSPHLVVDLNENATDYYLYCLSLQGADEPIVQDKSFIQTVRCRAVIQY